MSRARPPRSERDKARLQQARQVDRVLARNYPEARCSLDFRNAYELLVATILSAQCTDARVNQVTPALFQRCPNAPSLAWIDRSELEEIIRPTGFFRAKAKHLQAMAAQLVEQHDGDVPNNLDALTALPGVGRKTAHVVLGNAFGIASGVVVDTHVKRLAFRLGLTEATDPERIERDLQGLFPKHQWVDLAHRFINHGRKVCTALRPQCDACPLTKVCPQSGIQPRAIHPA